LRRARSIFRKSSLLLFFVLLAQGCGVMPVVKERRELMGTFVDVSVHHRDARKAEAAAERAFAEAERLEGMLSIYVEDSEASLINREAGGSPVRVSEETFYVIEAAVGYSRLSGGAFDISALPLVEMWGVKNGSGYYPDEDEITSAMALTGYENILLDAEARTVSLSREGMGIDLGGLAKGFIVDRMA
jgi:FAD:protein FMN transferase